ncbi:MAG: peptide-methionine (R)-S-oxide reductase [Alphaproteobacteria bacterium]|nr:MAG: peptide-methionine (R)-S-oxide reductase [Alphaproteobacteria bacterium]
MKKLMFAVPMLLAAVIAPAHAEAVKSKSGMDASHLTPEQKYVTLHDGTEPPFKNAYWDNHAEGIYVDAISGVPLFSSTDKFDSGTGWPSFTKPIDPKLVELFEDESAGMSRKEVRSSKADAHLGHLFDDGPKESGGQRFCINSSALKFVPKAEMEKRGYGKYLSLFRKGS